MSYQGGFDTSFPGEEERTDEQKRRRKTVTQAREFIVAFGSLLRQLRVHAATNQSVIKQLEATIFSIEGLREESDGITVVFAEGHTFVNGVWVRATRFMWEHSLFMTELLEDLGGRGLVMSAEFNSADVSSLAIKLLAGSEGGVNTKAPADLKLRGVKLIPAAKDEVIHQGRGALRDKARHVIREGLLIVGKGQTPKLDLSTRRRENSLIQSLIRIAEESTEDLMALTTIRDPSLPAAAHSLMVTIFSIAIGKLIGLRRRDLLRLGATALNHNIGETLIERKAISQPRELTPAERDYIESHALRGMHHILRNYGLKRGMVARAVVCAEHHIHWDGKGGYPFKVTENLHPFSRIIAISDVFNALISARHHREAYPPDQALKITIRSAESQLDPVLVRVFMGLVGRYPAGTVVELDTGEWAVVVGAGNGATPLKRPRILIVTDEDGFEVPDFEVVDLGERHKRRRAWLRTIVRTQDPKQLDMTVSAYLLADRVEKTPGKLDSEEFEERAAKKGLRAGSLG